MRPFEGAFSASGASKVDLCLADCTINTYGFNLRQGQGRQRAIEYLFAQRAGRIWESLGLRIGRAFDGFYEGRSIDSSFQRFCNAALAAVGDRAKISGRQIVNLKRIVNGKEQH